MNLKIRTFGRALLGLTLLSSFGTLGLAILPAQAQDATPARPSVAPAKISRIVLYFPAPDEKKVSREGDLNATIRILLKERLRDSGKFVVIGYSVADPAVQQALRDNTLAAADLMEPIAPEALQRIAIALNADRILVANAHKDEETLITDVQLYEKSGAHEWRANSVQQFKNPLLAEQLLDNGKTSTRKFRPVEIASFAADAIAAQLGLSSSLPTSPNNQALPPTLNPPKSNKKESKPKIRKEPKETNTAKATKQAAPPKTTKTDEVIDPATIAKSNVTVDTSPKQTKTDKIVTQTVTPNTKSSESKPRPEPKPREKAAALPDRVNGGFSEFSTDGAGGRVDDPKASVLTPNQNTGARFDNETTIARYRQSGDLANVIQALRRAINDKPKDVALRRQLILAYKERNLLDSALAEANRALQILPEESGLYRAKGDILAAKGDAAAATLAYNQAIQRGNGKRNRGAGCPRRLSAD